MGNLFHTIAKRINGNLKNIIIKYIYRTFSLNNILVVLAITNCCKKLIPHAAYLKWKLRV